MTDLSKDSDPPYEFDWFDLKTNPPGPSQGSYGVKQGTEIVCLTNRYQLGYIRAKLLAELLNTKQQQDLVTEEVARYKDIVEQLETTIDRLEQQLRNEQARNQ